MTDVTALDALILLTALGSGLVAGIFFAFSICVMRALARLPAAHGIAAMQSINSVIINPWFLGVFFGSAVACVLVLVAAMLHWQAPGAVSLAAGSLLYLVGSILVTGVFNVPLNDRLAGVSPESAQARSLWATYLTS